MPYAEDNMTNADENGGAWIDGKHYSESYFIERSKLYEDGDYPGVAGETDLGPLGFMLDWLGASLERGDGIFTPDGFLSIEKMEELYRLLSEGGGVEVFGDTSDVSYTDYDVDEDYYADE